MAFPFLIAHRHLWVTAVLALLCIGLASSCKEAPSSLESSKEAELRSGPPTLHPTISNSSLTRDYQNARLAFVLKFQNQSAETVYLVPPFLKLTTPSNEEIPLFLLPSAKVPQVSAGQSVEMPLKFWLEEKHLQSSLTLHLGEEKIVIKSDKPLDLSSLENAESKELKSIDW